ncbi:hypothetical protein Vadar_002500 [Vaccinium darrowii]|uniref:Uncharacterized protein n=1 Tax=Vaccinium darrowii TaxID=229202 RepID=A0ACB7YB54_9ERIC|nr:hypothetical protein Vadar_002500 [Vaccinium darrowii]
MEGTSGAKLTIVKLPKGENVPPARGKSIPIEGLRSRKKNAGDAALHPTTVDKDSVQASSRKRKTIAGDVTEKVEEDSSVAEENTPPSKKQSKSRPRYNVDIKVSGQSSTGKRPKAEEGTVGAKNKKPRKGEPVTETPFRSSLRGIVTLTNAQCRKSDKLIIEIIETYDPTKDKFRLGNTYLEITKADMVRVFGISCWDEFVSLRSGCRDAIKFVARREIKETRMTTTSKGLKSNKVHRKMPSADQHKLAQFWNEATNGTSMWCDTISRCNVYAEDLRSIIMDTAITGNVIDAYSELLLMEQERRVPVLTKQKDDGGYTQGGATLTSYVFTSCFLTLMAGKSNDERRAILGNMLPRTSAYRYLIFPIHHNFHWTLLVLDNEEGSWNFYNSMRSRTGFDMNLEAAKQLKIQIESYYKENLEGMLCTQDCGNIVQVEDCPQQVGPSLDCEIIVWHIIRQYFRTDKVGPKLLKDDCRAMRAEIIHAFLNDELLSWSSSHHMMDAGNKDRNTKQAIGGGEEYKKPSRTRKKK